MTAAGAEILLIGLLLGFFVSQIVQYAVSARSRGQAIDSETYAHLEQAVEQALARHLASGAVVAAAPAQAAAAPAPAPAAADEADAEEAEAAPAAQQAAAPEPAGADTETAAPAGDGELVPMKVHVGGQTHELQVRTGENMLDAALDRNVDLDYSCKEGSCDTCMVKILSGRENLNDITPEERDMLDEDQIREGYRLSCMVVVKGPVEFVQEER
ncbi:MAG: (2Fe-2S)-binding protein [Firmicutes bacterium]|nr:(2Fe-2S)-binding protein [Bacillota bacterium]